jgi:type I restriction enzyme S subunit
VLRLGNVKNDEIRFDSNPVFIDEDYASETMDYCLKSGDILITMTGTRAKRDYCFTVLINDEHLNRRNLYLNQRVGCLRFNVALNLNFINHCLKTDSLLDVIFSQATGTANQANIGKGAILNALLPLPPFTEQNAIVQKVNQLMSLCDQLEQHIESSQRHASQLMESLVRGVV